MEISGPLSSGRLDTGKISQYSNLSTFSRDTSDVVYKRSARTFIDLEIYGNSSILSQSCLRSHK